MFNSNSSLVSASNSKVGHSSSMAGSLVHQDSSVESNKYYGEALKLISDKYASYSSIMKAVNNLELALQYGHPDAASKLSKLFFYGMENLEPDYHRCSHYLEQCTDPECFFLLGMFYYNGLGGKARSFPHVLSYLTIAAEKNNESAMAALGWMYSTGHGVTASCLKSRDYLYKVASRVASQYEHERLLSFKKIKQLTFDHQDSTQSSQDIIEFYQFNMDNSDESSLMFLGQVFYEGIGGFEHDKVKAREFFTKAADLGNIKAIGYLGLMDFFGDGLDKPDYREAYRRLRKASRDNVNPKERSAQGLLGMGLLHWKGIQVEKDLQEAIRFIKKAVELDPNEPNYYLGKVLSDADPVQFDDQIFSAYMISMRSGNALAGYELGKMNMAREATCGISKFLLWSTVEKDLNLRDIENANELFYAGKRSRALSVYFYYSLRGNEVAFYNTAFTLELMSQENREDADDFRRRALTYWSLSSENDDAMSLVKTGDYFYYGWGLDHSYPTTAAAYYHRAIEKKSPQAAFNLGYLHEHGIGVVKDYVMAHRYYQQALNMGDTKASGTWLPAKVALLKLDLKQKWINLNSLISRYTVWIIPLFTILLLGLLIIAIQRIFNSRKGRTIETHAPASPATEDNTVTIPATTSKKDDTDEESEEREPLVVKELPKGVRQRSVEDDGKDNADTDTK